MGRPAIPFSQEAADEICERLAKGESLRAICSMDRPEFIPGPTTVFKWLANEPEFAKQYAHARELQAEHYVDEIIAIADSPTATTNRETGEAEMRDPQRDRLRVDARKWIASKLAPKKDGDRVFNEHTGADGSPISLVVDRPPRESREEWLARREKELKGVGPPARPAN